MEGEPSIPKKLETEINDAHEERALWEPEPGTNTTCEERTPWELEHEINTASEDRASWEPEPYDDYYDHDEPPVKKARGKRTYYDLGISLLPVAAKGKCPRCADCREEIARGSMRIVYKVLGSRFDKVTSHHCQDACIELLPDWEQGQARKLIAEMEA